MKLAKFLSFFVFVIFFISSASAILVYGDWEDGTQSLTVTQGEEASFYADFGTINPPMTLNIFVLNSNYQTVEYIENDLIINDYSYAAIYTLDTTSYNPGKYSIVLNGEDGRSEADIHTIYLTVEEEVIVDNNAPIVEILSPTHGNTYNSIVDTLNYLADDPEGNLVDCRYSDGSFTSQWNNCFGSFDIVSSEGENTFTVYARDSYGNIGSDTVTFTVDTNQNGEVPTITILGDNPLNLNLGENYIEYGATAYDPEDGDLTSQITTNDNEVDTSTVGTYEVFYTVTDSAGNTAQEIRQVNVVDSGDDTTAPIITVITPQASVYNNEEITFEVEVNEESDVVFNLNDEGNVSMTEVNPNEFRGMLLTLLEGNHSVTFYATDLSGNVGSETVEFSIDLDESFEFILDVIVPKQGIEYDEEITFKVETNAVAEVVFSLNGEPNVSMDYQGSEGGILSFIYEDMISEGDHEVIFYAEDSAGNIYSKKVTFSTDDGSSRKEDKKDEDNFYDEKYWDQVTHINTPIHINEDSGEGDELTLCQKFLAWFKNFFGFEFFYFMFGLFLLLVILILIYIFKKYREYYL